MARLARLVVPNYPHHLIQRGNDRQLVFRDEEDYGVFLKCVRDAARRFKVAVHAYVLMPNHFHLLATPADETGLSRMMQWVGRYYVPYFNRKYQRTGTLWQGRYRTTLVDPDRYLLACSRYIELNPVRAELVAAADHYPWSSCMHHIGVKADSLVTDHALYWALGNTPFQREAAYREALNHPLKAEEIEQIRSATNKGWLLGGEEFKQSIAKQTTRRLNPVKKGRPRKLAGKNIDTVTNDKQSLGP
jgi:putative transposase